MIRSTRVSYTDPGFGRSRDESERNAIRLTLEGICELVNEGVEQMRLSMREVFIKRQNPQSSLF